METTIHGTKLALVKGDITEQAVDAVVNAANSSLLGGGGVDGAIHRKGGSSILDECREIRNRQGKLPTGEAVTTTAGDLPAKRVIHTVGPVWNGGDRGEPEKLADAYRNSLNQAVDLGLETVAFPSLSTGAYRYPLDEAAEVALRTISAFLEEHEGELREVRMVLFSQDDLEVYEDALEQIG
jgi:O-acetyl-ADP-ribose deacetylase (regulator of RNase III)